MTPLKKAVWRKTDTFVRDGGKMRALLVGVKPGALKDTVCLRLAGTRRTEMTTVDAVWGLAVKQRVARERADKKAAQKQRKQNRGGSRV